MESIKVKKTTVLKALKTNKQRHHEEFEEALYGWADEMKKKLNDFLDKLKLSIQDPSALEKIVFNVHLPKPVSYEKEYDKAIMMVEYEIREEIEISSKDFSKYFQDEWSWKENFFSNTELYKSKF